MKKAKIADLRDGLSRYLEYVRRGGRVRVMDRDTPVAEIVPLGSTAASALEEDTGRLGDLERRGILIRATAKLDPSFLRRKLPAPRASVVATLLEERRDGR